jgi:hypothetical protein
MITLSELRNDVEPGVSTRRNVTQALLGFICAIRVVFCCCLGIYPPDHPITSRFPALIPLQTSPTVLRLRPNRRVL